MRLYIGNFSFETVRDRHQELSKPLKQLEAELATVWLAVAEAGDLILCPQPISSEYLIAMQAHGVPMAHLLSVDELSQHHVDDVCCWGWSLPMRRFCEERKLPYHAPSLASIWKANKRVFSVELELRLGCEPPGIRVLTTMNDIDTWSQAAGDASWVLKTDLSQSGRGQFRGAVSSQMLGWLRKNFSRGESVIAEPMLSSHREIGCQWEISPSGDTAYIGATELLSNERGGYLGSQTGITAANDPQLEQIIATQRKVVEQIALEGYFGPVGIDAMVYVANNGSLQVRPLQDINARWTMGRIALGWEKIFKSPGRWIFSTDKPADNAIRTCPEQVDGRAVLHAHWWIPDIG